MLDRMAAAPGVEVNVSVKLTQMGLDIDEELCAANLTRILDKAQAVNGFVRLDMEGSDYTQRTLDFFERRLFERFGRHCGVVIQAMLRRSEGDVAKLIAMKARVRLCKGAYLEPPSVAFPDKADVDQNYVTLMERLLAAGNYPGIATHDQAIIAHARRFVRRESIARRAGSSSRCSTASGGISSTSWSARRPPDAGLCAVRDAVVPLSHAPARGAAGQHRVHSRQRRQGVRAPLVTEVTLAGYMAKHERAAAFGGSDGHAYSVGVFVEDEPDARGLYGASLLFVRWAPSGDRPVGPRGERACSRMAARPRKPPTGSARFRSTT